ncbi:MAG: DNA-binding response regulator [Chitinophagaceae bacterium]|nr:DNA-binding response regulator [Chitinophagaceae bacterium]
MKLRCIAIDDEKLALDLLEDNINRVPYLQLVAKCRNAFEAAPVLASEKIDLIILDIQMPGLNGLQFIERQLPRPIVIFVTAYDNYAIDAFNVDAIDYLVKPVTFERFLQATNKALLYSSYNLSNASFPAADPEFIFINVEYNLVKVVISDVVYIEGMKDYIRIHLHSNARPLLTRISMKSIQELLPFTKFVRIHRSYIVSIAAISIIRKDSLILQPSHLELPVSSGYKNDILAVAGKNRGTLDDR